MKKLKIIVMIVLVAVSSVTFAQKSLKIGHINSNDLLAAMPEKDSIQSKIEAHAKKLSATLDAMKKEYDTKVAEYQSTQDGMSYRLRKKNK